MAPCDPAERRFAREEVSAWSDVAVRTRTGEDAVVVFATCPLCGHEIDDFIHLGESKVGMSFTSVLSCNCESKHDGAPAGTLGCGALSAVRITLTVGGEGTLEVTGRATLRERYWDQEAATYERAMTTRLAGIAEKWGQTVAAIFGLFGIALIVEANEELDDLAASTAEWPYAAVATAALVAGFATIGWVRLRSRNEHRSDEGAFWTGAFTVAIGAFGITLLIACETPFGADVSFGIAAAIAIALALASTAFAGLAAQGTPKWIAALTGETMRRRHMEITAHTVRDLMRARFTTIWATIFLGVAVAIMWFAPQQSTATTNVKLTLRAAGEQPCGELRARTGRRFALDPGGGKPVEFYDFDEVVRLDPVARC
jgi:hypothetical protein